jgi:hypothetical protein
MSQQPQLNLAVISGQQQLPSRSHKGISDVDLNLLTDAGDVVGNAWGIVLLLLLRWVLVASSDSVLGYGLSHVSKATLYIVSRQWYTSLIVYLRRPS